MRSLALIAVLILSACGADGPPQRPGVSVGGEVQIGMAFD
jgi:hypothetical protein